MEQRASEAAESTSTAGNQSGGSVRRQHLQGLDGLRGVAAVAVMVAHVNTHGAGGSAGGLSRIAEYGGQGLTLFFALSGFLLYGPYAAAIVDGRPLPSLRRYLVNRGLRIFPAYWAIFVLVAFVFGAAYVQGTQALYPEDNIGRLTDPVHIALNFFLVQTLVPETVTTGIGPAWSLTTELVFYLVLPLLAWGAYRIAARATGRRSLFAFLPPLLLIAVGWGTTLALELASRGLEGRDSLEFSWGKTWTAVLDRSLLSQAELFGYGMLAAVAIELLRRRGVSRVPLRVSAVLAVAGTVLVCGAILVAGPLTTELVGIGAGLLVAGAVLPGRAGGANILAKALEKRAVRGLGLISYSIYLWHVPVIWWLREHGLLFTDGVPALIADLAIVSAVVISLATLTYFFVERPAMRMRARLAPSRSR